MYEMGVFWLRVATALYGVGLLHVMALLLRRKSGFLKYALFAFLVGAVLIELSLLSSAYAQIYSARRLTRRVAPQQQQQQQPSPPPADAPAPATTATVPAPAPVPVPVRPQPVVRVQPPVDPEKAKAAKEEALRKTVEFQKKRAEEGSESAQYELGVRYLKGDGVEIKSIESISATLNPKAHNRGLYFTPAMGALCGEQHQVDPSSPDYRALKEAFDELISGTPIRPNINF